jgi:hypothetical protein
LGQILLHLLLSELEPEHSKKSNGVSEHLEVADHSTPDNDGGDDQEDILQDTAKGEDKTGGLTDLMGVVSIQQL